MVLGIQLILAIKDIPKDYQKLRLRLELELNRLICWGEAVGLLEDEGLTKQTTLNVTITGPLRHTVQDLIELLWAEVGKITREPPKFYQQKHSGGSSVSVSSRESSRSKSSKLGQSQRYSLECLFQRVWFGGIKFKDRLVWTSVGADKLETLIYSLQHVNNTVIGLTETKTQQEIHQTVTATNIGLLSLQNSVADLKQLIEALQISVSNRPEHFGALSLPSLPQQNEEENLLLDLAALKAKRKADACTPGDLAQIDRRSLSGLKAIDTDNRRYYATYERSRGYWVEWKKYPADFERDARPSKEDIRRYIVQELVSTLNTKQPVAFRVPRGIGYFDDSSCSRFGLVFKKPDTVPAQSRISTLTERFEADPYPDLADRISLARAVTQTVYYLHAVDWLHKAIRPQNIVFAARWHDPVQYDSPLISGFDYSRPAYSLDMTQEPSGESSYDDDFYRHPSVQLCNPQRRSGGYRKTYDVYSLGIVLVEIALWKPIGTLFRSPNQHHMTRTWLLDERSDYLRNVKFAAGRAYHDVVRICLLGLEEEAGAGGEAATDEAAKDQNFMFNFEKLVVRKLQQICVE